MKKLKSFVINVIKPIQFNMISTTILRLSMKKYRGISVVTVANHLADSTK